MPAKFWQNFDWALLILTLIAASAGVVAIAGASDPAVRLAFAKKQVEAIVLGIVLLMICAAIDYHFWARWRNGIYVLMLGLLVAVRVVGHHTLGAQRWISIGGFDFQPSEFAKLMLVFWLAGGLEPMAGELFQWRQTLVPLLGTAVAAGLVALQPDLGTSLVFLAVFVGVLFAAGFPPPRLMASVVLVVGGGVLLIVAHLRWHLPLPLHSYQLNRLLAFLHPQQDPRGTGYHVIQSEMAIGSGRVFGNGLFSGGVNNQLRYLPESQTDFIFASIGNMAGFVGAGAVLLMLAMLVWRALHCMASAKDALGAILAGGIATMLAFQTVLNSGVALGVMPVTGVPLPFFSMGGSATLVNFAAMGVLEGIYARRKKIQF